MKRGGGVEQLPGKIKGGNYVSGCENHGVFVILMFVCMFLQKQYKLRGFSIAFDLGVQKVGSISAPHVNKWSTIWLTCLNAHVDRLLNPRRFFFVFFLYEPFLNNNTIFLGL